MTQSEQSVSAYSAERVANLTQPGTRRLHLNTGEVWRVREYREDGDDRRLSIVRERDQVERIIRLVYWLGDSWGRPRSRAGARS
jgi:hypothetical protein